MCLASRSVGVQGIELPEGGFCDADSPLAPCQAREFTPVARSRRVPRHVLHAVPVYALVFAAGVVENPLSPPRPLYAAERPLSRARIRPPSSPPRGARPP